MIRFALSALLTAICFAGAGAQEPAGERDVERFVRGRKALRRGSLESLRSHKISIGGRRTAAAGDVAKRLFADHNAFTGEIRKGRAALKADPEIEEEVVEVEGSTILTTSTSMTVVDPEALRKVSPEFAKFRSGKLASAKLAELDQKARADFDDFKKKALSFAAEHPLKKAADAGDQELLTALAEGKGDVRVTTTVVIPNGPLGYDDAGKPSPPKKSAEGLFDYEADPKKVGKRAPGSREPVDAGPSTKEKGHAVFKAKFLAGDTEGQSWVWSRRWEVPTGHFSVTARAWYSYGLRIPIEITAKTDPATIERTGDKDLDSNFSVYLKARAFDAGTSFYEEVGLSGDDLHDGKEFVLSAGFQVTFSLKVFGLKINSSLPKDDDFGFSQNFAPPFGASGTESGFDIWIPSEVTHTRVSILGVVVGSLEAGVNVSGKGTIYADYTALYGKDELKSWYPGQEDDAKKLNRLKWEADGPERRLISELPALEHKGGKKDFGCVLSRPEFEWAMRLTPGVRGVIAVHAKPIYNDSYTIGPLWLDELAFDIGTWKLGAHPGTIHGYRIKNGEKSWLK
ncbi:MAG: hypothetical protein FD180_2457 [Planctomycetota bacterium]|nr:MAG: hypothetical protein FD180_2457 [Planctomycetota bacterium]